jgi:hypothetical protein
MGASDTGDVCTVRTLTVTIPLCSGSEAILVRGTEPYLVTISLPVFRYDAGWVYGIENSTSVSSDISTILV